MTSERLPAAVTVMDPRPTASGLVDRGVEDRQLSPITTTVMARVHEISGEQHQHHRGIKRSRRDRGSTAKERISKMPPCAAGKRSSIYRGVTRHRWTGRYEAHLWDKTTWNQSQNKKGKQVYLGAYDEEEAAARAYDLAALKYWGPGTLINFPLSDYTRDVEEMQNVSREEYLASLRRKSSGFSRGVSKYRGIAKSQLNNGRWESRVGKVLGNKYLCFGTYGTSDDGKGGSDNNPLAFRGVNAVTQIDLSRYLRWLHPKHASSGLQDSNAALSPNTPLTRLSEEHHQGSQDEHHSQEPVYQLPSLGLGPSSTQRRPPSCIPALTLLIQSPMFQQMLDRAASMAALAECDSMSTDPSEVSFIFDQQQQQQQHQQQQHHRHHHHHQQQMDNGDLYSAAGLWEKATSNHHHQPQVPSPIDDDGSVYQDESTGYHHPVTSSYHQDIVIGNHYPEVGGGSVYHVPDDCASFQRSAASNYRHDDFGHHHHELQYDEIDLQNRMSYYPEMSGHHHHHHHHHHHLPGQPQDNLADAFGHSGLVPPWIGVGLIH